MSPSASANPTGSSELKQVERRIARMLVVVMVLAVVVYAALLLYGDFGALIESARQLSPPTAIAALALSTGSFGVRYLRWEYYLHRLGIVIPAAESALVFFAGFSMTLTPMRAGEVLKSLMLKQTRDLPVAQTAPIMLAERIGDLGALVLLAAVGCLAFKSGALFCAAGIALVLLLWVFCAYRPLGEWLLGIAGKLWLVNRKASRIRAAYETIWTLSGARPFLVSLLSGTFAWGMQCLSLYVVAASFTEVSLSLPDSLFIYAAPLLAGTLALLPGGLGLTEASMTALMLELGGPASSYAAAASITLIVRLVALWWAVILGFAALAVWRVRFSTSTVPTSAVQ